MTKDEIKKGLKCCETDWCVRCPYFECIGCEVGLKQDVLNLIAEQEKEIERLKAEFKQLETNAEILARGVRDLNHENYELTEKIKQAQIDVLNKVKDMLDNAPNGWAYTTYIDELIEEVENDK